MRQPLEDLPAQPWLIAAGAGEDQSLSFCGRQVRQSRGESTCQVANAELSLPFSRAFKTEFC